MLTIIAKVVQAFVLRTNQKIKAERSLWELNYVDSDGVLTPFYLAVQYFWISYQQAKHGIKMDWTLNYAMEKTSRLRANLVLSEMLIETDVNQERRIGTAEAAFTFLSETEHFS